VNLEQLRKQAKELARAARAGDEAALARIQAHAPARERVPLADAQLALAREHGHRSWRAFVAALEASPETFVLAATVPRTERAQRLLAAAPEIARDTWAALVLGDGWEGDVNERGGPRDWPPLAYVCHSALAPPSAVRALLERGADPNVVFDNDWGPVSPLFAATSVRHDAELLGALLDAGADVDDTATQFGDSLYHSVEPESPDCTRVLLERGAKPKGSNALAHALDYERPEHVRLLLEAGADPNEGALLVHAVRRGRSPEYLRLLAGHGAELDRRGGEWSTPPDQQRTAYQNAILRGFAEHAAVLEELGASTDVAPEDLAVASILRGEPAELPANLVPDAQEALILAVLDGRIEIFDPRFHGHVGGGPPGTLLHHASWVGDAELVQRLIALGADPVARSGAKFDTPLAWAFLASEYWKIPGRDYVGVAEALVAAGAELEPRFEEVAVGPLAEWLEARN
jgi:ankyrin repeat protein